MNKNEHGMGTGGGGEHGMPSTTHSQCVPHDVDRRSADR